MRKIEYQRWKENILSQVDDVETLRQNTINAGGIERYIRRGGFACYYSQALDELKEVYKEDFDEKKYFNKDGSWKWKNGEAYVWTVYVWKMRLAIEKLLNENNTKGEK